MQIKFSYCQAGVLNLVSWQDLVYSDFQVCCHYKKKLANVQNVNFWISLQWSLWIVDTIGTHPFVLCREVVLF